MIFKSENNLGSSWKTPSQCRFRRKKPGEETPLYSSALGSGGTYDEVPIGCGVKIAIVGR